MSRIVWCKLYNRVVFLDDALLNVSIDSVAWQMFFHKDRIDMAVHQCAVEWKKKSMKKYASNFFSSSHFTCRIWFFSVWLDFNTWPHSQHLNFLSSLWYCMCLLRRCFVLNVFPHVSHTNSFVFKCTMRCSLRADILS